MNRVKTEVKVVVTSASVKDGEAKSESAKSGVRQIVRTVSTCRATEPEGARGTRTPISSVSQTSNTTSVRTPASTTPRTSGGLTATPKTPAMHTPKTADNGSATPHHLTPSTAASKHTPRSFRTPLPSGAPKTPATNTPRHVPPFPKRMRKVEEQHKSESSHANEASQRSKHAKDVNPDTKDDDGKKRENGSFRKVLSSNNLNVPSNTRFSGGRLSTETKTPVSSRTSLGRPSSAKASLGTNTPSVTVTRRSSLSLRRTSDHPQQPLCGLITALTPDVISHHNGDLSVSPNTADHHGRTESTAVSVGVRIRPLNQRELSASEPSAIEVLGNTVKISSESGSSHTFSYDHCFWSCDESHPLHASQEMVYKTIAQPLLEKAYEGYNACLFAYGQTGSGKSFTMLGDGSVDDPDMDVLPSVGVIPRFCRELFERAKYIHSHNPPEHQLPQHLVEVELSYFEIYNERIYDLLSAGGGGDRREALRVREHPETGPYVEGVARHLVSSYDDLQTWLLLGNKERSIAATGMNDKSSRSHAVFTIRLTQMTVEDVEGEQLESSKVSIINLVDLAGSERVAASQSQGDRLKEGVCINKSLLTLGKVITALAESAGRRRVFIPYRESVLTYLLKESLGGNSRTAMIATVSPCKSHMEESLSTLRYAQQARKIVNHNYVNEDPTALIIRSLKEEVERLRRQQLVKSPTMLFDAELMEAEDKQTEEEGADDEKQRALEEEKENIIREKEKEKMQAIKEKEAEIALLKEQLRSQQLLSERNRNLEQRLKENEAKQQQALENQRLQGIAGKDDKGPQLVNLTEDPQLSETLSYRIKEGITKLGHSQSDLVLRGLHCEDVHCSIVNRHGRLTLHPKIDTDTYINGKLVTSPQQLHHEDRLILAGIYYFRVNNPTADASSKTKPTSNMDFYFSQQELLREQEARLRREAEATLAASREELEKEMRLQRDELMQDIYEASSQLRNKEQLVQELEGTQWKLEEEKRLLEEQLMRNRKAASHQSLDISLRSPKFPSSNLLQEVEAVFNESVMEIRRENSFYSSPRIGFQIKEANQIAKKLRKPYEFMVQELLNEHGIDVMVLLKDLHHQTTAKLTIPMFSQKLQLLRDLVQGEENEEEVFDEGLVWERSEDVSCVPGFINKLRDCINSSFNCSFSAPPPPVVSKPSTNRRRSSFIFGLEKTSSTSTCSTVGETIGPAAVAAAIHNSFSSLPCPSATSQPLLATLNSVVELHNSTQVINDHVTEPEATLLDEEFSKQLIIMLCTSQVAIHSLSSSGYARLETSCRNCLQIQEKFQKAPLRINTCTSKIFQGVKNEVDSLVDEECRVLQALLQGLTCDIGKFAIMAALPIPHTSKLKPGGTLCVNFTEGIRSGLETLLFNSADVALHANDILTSSKKQNSSKDLIEAAQSCMANLASFLKRFARLNAAVEYLEGISEEDQCHVIAEWVARVESAADTILHLGTAIDNISNHVQTSQDINLELWQKQTAEMKRQFDNLISFASLRNTSTEDVENCSLSSNFDGENSVVFMEKLHVVTKNCEQSLNTLITVVNEASSGKPADRDGNKFSVQWPKNCEEYLKYLRTRSTDARKSPMKSSLRSTASYPMEEKRVRFDVSFDSTSRSYIENSDSVDI